MIESFDSSFLYVVGHEGGYVNNPHDPGGETNFGISKRSHPDEDIRNMTPDRARKIYRENYWGPAHCDLWPCGVDFAVFDMAVNCGVVAAVTTLQGTVGVLPDGIVGPNTRGAVVRAAGADRSKDRFDLLNDFHVRRTEYYFDLRPELIRRFGFGWNRRVMKAFAQSLVIADLDKVLVLAVE